MDLATPLGMALAMVALIISIFMEGGGLGQLWNPSALILVLGGTIGFTLTSFRTREFAALPRAIARAFSPPKEDRSALADEILSMAEAARRHGLLVLQDKLASVRHPLLRRGLELAIDGVEPQAVRELMEQTVSLQRQRTEAMVSILEQAGGYAPTVGIIGTVMGLVHVLGNLGDTERLGPAIAAAFMATFYGIFTANFFWLPLAHKLRRQADSADETARMVAIGVAGIHTGESPSRLRERLRTFVEAEPARREAVPAEPEAAAEGAAEAVGLGAAGTEERR